MTALIISKQAYKFMRFKSIGPSVTPESLYNDARSLGWKEGCGFKPVAKVRDAIYFIKE